MPVQQETITSELYFECHVTLDPVQGERLALLERLSAERGFKVATFLMEKDGVTPDALTSARDKDYLEILQRMILLVEDCRMRGFVVRRYKIENTLLDSKMEGDILRLLSGPSTGRLASTGPNLQNIPVRTEEGQHIREAFIASKHADSPKR